MLVTSGTLTAMPTILDHYAGGITERGGLGDAGTEGNSIDGPINLLLVGIDERPGEAENGARADSIIIAHVPASHDAVYLTSIPRDSLVDIPAFPDSDYQGGREKINAAFEHGADNGGGREKGMSLLAETVSQAAGGLKFNGAAIVDFNGLRGLIRAVGGVRLCVDEKVTSVHIGRNTRTGEIGVPFVLNPDGTVNYLKRNWKPQVYTPGCHQFKDWQALDYARQRDLLANGDSDYGRQRHQQQLIKAIIQKTTSTGVITNPVKVGDVLSSLGDAVSFYNNGVPLADWIFTLKGIKPDQMTMLKTNAGKFNPQTIDGTEYEVLSPTSLQLLQSITNDDVASFVAAHPDWVTPGT